MEANPLYLYSLVYGAGLRCHIYLNVSIHHKSNCCTSHSHRGLRKRDIRRNVAQRAMLLAVLAMYSLSAICYALDITSLWRELNVFLPQRLSPSAAEIDVGFELNIVNSPLHVAQTACFFLNVCYISFSCLYYFK
jgi:hypothetical protein